MPLFRKSVSKPIQSASLFRSMNDDLRQAAASGDAETVLELIKKGAKFIPNKEGRTALHLAAMQNHVDIVRTLIEHGCDLNSQDKSGYTAVHRACLEGRTEIVRLLLDTNLVNVDKQDFVQENTALHEAAWHGYSAIVEMLMSAKSNVYIRNKTGATALHLACQNGHNRSARLLVQNGCKPDVKDKYDDTPLHTSCRFIHAGVTRVLLSANANANEQNKNGDTPLHLACNLGQKKISRMLLDAGAKADLKNKQGETSIDIAVRKQLSDLVDVLKATAKGQKFSCENAIGGTTARTSRSKIRERLQAAKDAGSTWQLLFQDWTPYGSENRSASNNQNTTAIGGGHQQQRPCPNLYPIESGFSNPIVASPSLKPIDENGDQYCVDLAGNLRKAPVACYCAPFFYHLAKHSNEAHMELLEEIDACQNNLSNEISDLRQVTERKIDDLNRAVKCQRPFVDNEQQRPKPGWHRLLSTTKRRLYCAAAAAAVATTPTSNPYQSSMGSSARLVRSKSESEIETDIERGRTIAIADDLNDSDSASNASDDLYFDRRFLLRSRCGRANNGCATISRSTNKTSPTSAAVVAAEPISAITMPTSSNAVVVGNVRHFVPLIPPSSTPVSQSTYNRETDASTDGVNPRSANFDETMRQFNKLESDSFHDSSCTTPTTTGSCSGMSSSRHCTPDTSVRSSIYSSQSGGSYLSSSQLSNSKSLQPSLDSGYGGGGVGVGAKADHENNQVSPFQIHPTSRFSSSSSSPLSSQHYHLQQQQRILQPPKIVEVNPNSSSMMPNWRLQDEKWPPSMASNFGKSPSRAEAETQTDSANNNQQTKKQICDSHEYTELECILRTTTSNFASRRQTSTTTQQNFAEHRQQNQFRNGEKPPPVLPIPPPPRKPLPPLPIGNIDASPPKRSNQHRSTRYNPANACLSTNV